MPIGLQDLLAMPANPDPEELRRRGLLPPVPPMATPPIIPQVGQSSGTQVPPMQIPKPAPETTVVTAKRPEDEQVAPMEPPKTKETLPMQQPGEPNLLNSPRASLMGFPSREEARRGGEDLNAPAGGPHIIPPIGSAAGHEVNLERSRDEALHPWGGPENHPGLLGKVGHVAAKIGNIAGDIVAPAVMANIPGTELNKKIEGEREEKLRGQAETRESEAGLRKANTGLLEDQAKYDTPEKRQAYMDANPDLFKGTSDFEKHDYVLSGKFPQKEPTPPAAKIAFHYETQDGKMLAVYEDGTTKEFPAGKEKEIQEKYPGLTADELAMFPPPAREKFKTDEEFAAARADWGQKLSKYKENQKIREAIAGRAPLQREYSVLDTKNGNQPSYVTPEMLAAEPGRYMPAGPAATALNKTGLMEDIRSTLNKARDAVGRMGNEGFDAKQRAWIAAGLAAPQGQAGQYTESLLRSALTDAQQDYIIALFQMKENAMAMRTILGAGQGSEDLRTAITQTLPGAGTPSKEFFNKQVNAVEQTLNRLERGVPKVPLNPEKQTTGNKEGGEAPKKKWNAATGRYE
jgi:hypothetical protein